jgi:hypothetical protein
LENWPAELKATFPRLISRGLIEAIASPITTSTASTFPGLITRGLIEAAGWKTGPLN